MNIEDLPDDSESSDEDYVPDGANTNLPSEEESDGDPEDDVTFQEGPGKRNRRQPRGNKKKKRKGKVVEEEEEPTEEAKPTVSKVETDSLWADFMKDTGFKPKSARSQTTALTTSIIEKPSETKVENKEPEKTASPKTIKVTEVFKFAGEEVTVEKEVKADQIKGNGSPSGSFLTKKPAKAGGINSILSQLGKTRKISTLEKSKLDWDKFKKDENIEDELQAYGKSKDGYLERQDFLQRADLRRFEIEKDIRTNLRGNRTNNV